MEKGIRERDKLYIGNLPFELENEQLGELFKLYGEVKMCFVAKNKGFGFVKMSSPEEADKAKEALDGTQFQDRKIKVEYAIPKNSK